MHLWTLKVTNERFKMQNVFFLSLSKVFGKFRCQGRSALVLSAYFLNTFSFVLLIINGNG